MSNSAFEDFCQKFRIQELTIEQFNHWTWSVRPAQGTLGATVISLNRPASAWGETNIEEGAELSSVVTEVERRLGAAFGYSKINYLMLMMVDDHVHFHVFPRYSSPVNFNGKNWVDEHWPKPPDLLGGVTDISSLESIKIKLLGS